MTNREMDAFIAEKCFGWTEISNPYFDCLVGNNPKFEGARSPYRVIPSYTEDMGAAWPVFEWLVKNNPWKSSLDPTESADIVLTTLINSGILVYFIEAQFEIPYEGSAHVALFEGTSVTEVICKAAVAAVQEIEKNK